MLIDTDVLIWYMRGDPTAYQRIEALQPKIQLSAVTQMELLQGMRDKAELRAFEATTRRWQARLIPISESISDRAVRLVRDYALSHGMRLGDALIAATALALNEPLLTANDKHYRMINGLSLQHFRASSNEQREHPSDIHPK
ncbi:putative ribonuclease VapC19 [Thiorhodovibrio winogradskyi]|uniref:Ribonuclease VapC n=1 Tax=Thiorhodovibrio winogradskyi TaxID=77007 RepID=A0ABZ0S766_9GAMM|nr:type II toxin-antitoxin system VapC family toxin [Thiorhodovibrio winogradskyi]